MNGLRKIDSIMYRVSDLKRAEAFYKNVLGLTKVWDDVDAKMIGLVFAESDSEIVVHADPHLPDFDYSYLVENVRSFCQTLKREGYVVLLEPIEARLGNYAVIPDPDGNKIPIIDLTKFGNTPQYNLKD